MLYRKVWLEKNLIWFERGPELFLVPGPGQPLNGPEDCNISRNCVKLLTSPTGSLDFKAAFTRAINCLIRFLLQIDMVIGNISTLSVLSG